MTQTQIIMGMPITIEITHGGSQPIFDKVFNYFKKIDNRFSTYKSDSEISKINNGLEASRWSKSMKDVFKLCEQTKEITNGYFDIDHNGQLDPSGLVKGWAIDNAANILRKQGLKDFYVEAGGDIQVSGTNSEKKPWAIGIRNPFNINEVIKIVSLSNEGVATSGTYIRGQHIYNPKNKNQKITEVKSLSVIAGNVYEADRFATAAFAMGRKGIKFIESIPGLEGYMVDDKKIATYTTGFERYVIKNA